MMVACHDISDPSDRYRPVVYLDERSVSADVMAAAIAGVETAGPESANRFLIHLHSGEWVSKINTLIDVGLPIQVFTDAEAAIAMPGVIRFPPGSTPLDIENFGLAMSDAVIANAQDAEVMLASRARVIGKPIITPDRVAAVISELSNFADDASIEGVKTSLRKLDPETAVGVRGHLLQHWGRLDSVLLDLMAGTHKLLTRRSYLTSPTSSRRHFQRVLHVFRVWNNASYFAPKWDEFYPSASLPINGPMIEAFDWLDRAATAGARLYRDLVWIIHAFAFTAVFSAVSGAIVRSETLPAVILPVCEGLSLVFVVVSYVSARRLHTLWAACRVGAEQLRVARMSLPLLVVPPALLGPDRDPDAGISPRLDEAAAGKEKAVVLALVKRALRKQGPSAIRQPPSIENAALWIKHVVKDQLTYHERNHDKLEAVESFETRFNIAIFVMVALAVCYEVVAWTMDLPETSALLFLTACGPAAVSALHGATVRMEIRRRAELSRLYADKLHLIVVQLDRIVEQPSLSSWTAIRELITRATNAMGSEADDWHSAVLLAPVALP